MRNIQKKNCLVIRTEDDDICSVYLFLKPAGDNSRLTAADRLAFMCDSFLFAKENYKKFTFIYLKRIFGLIL